MGKSCGGSFLERKDNIIRYLSGKVQKFKKKRLTKSYNQNQYVRHKWIYQKCCDMTI